MRIATRVVWVPSLLALASVASAQSTIYSEDFESGAPGWTFEAAVGGCSWAVDGTPALSFGDFSCGGLGDIASKSPIAGGTFALNWNNGTDIDYGGTLTAGNSANGPLIALTSLAGVIMTFDDFYEMDSCSIPNDHKRFVEFVSSTGTVMKSVQLTYSDAPDTETSCHPVPLPKPVVGGTAGNWNDHHSHTIDLSTLTDTSFRIRFRVQTTLAVAPYDPAVEDAAVGWFVDNIAVICPVADVAAPPVPVTITPAAGSVQISPVTFDWADSIDTGPCGPGAVTYVLEIDDPLTVGVDFTLTPSVSTAVQALAPSNYNWRVRAIDAAGNMSAFSAPINFDVEVNLPPTFPDTLFVNESAQGAQTGQSGFVDPVIDRQPAFSAIYRDPNATPDFATQVRYQVSTDPTFAIVTFDSGVTALSGPVADDTRCPDLPCPVELSRDTVYFWRVIFVDAGGLSSPFSVAQSFRVGDDFEFGVRPGNSNHSRKCWIATAAFGSAEAPPVRSLQQWRGDTMETAGAGRLASKAYDSAGRVVAPAFAGSRLVRGAILPMSRIPAPMSFPATVLALLAIAAIGISRVLSRR